MDNLALYDSMLRDLRRLLHGRLARIASAPSPGFVELEIEWLEESPSTQARSC